MSDEIKCECCEGCPTDCCKCCTGPDGKAHVKDSWLWIKDSKGFGSVTVTFTAVAFWVTTMAYVFSMFEKIGPLVIRQFDVAACSAYFIPVLCLYFGRKATEAKFNTTDTTNK